MEEEEEEEGEEEDDEEEEIPVDFVPALTTHEALLRQATPRQSSISE